MPKMTSKFVLAIDPGRATGWSLGEYSDTQPFILIDYGVFHDGVIGISQAEKVGDFLDRGGVTGNTTIVLERYIQRIANPGDPSDALEVTGFVRGVHNCARYEEVLRTAKARVPDQILKDHEYWRTGSQVGHVDGRDVNDATKIAISWLCFNERHQPTIERYFPDGAD